MSNDGFLSSQADSSLPQLQAVSLSLSGGAADGLIYIEHFTAGTEKDGCTARNRPWLAARNDSSKSLVLFRPSCKTWGCLSCGLVNRNRWIATAISGVEQLKAADRQVDFLTLTSHEKLRGDASWRVFPPAWDKLGKRYRRAVPDGSLAAYMAVPERHADGSLHTHAIITGGLPRRWWKDNARACGLGFMADVQEVADLGVGGYVGKYLGKTLGEEWPRNKRRVNTSRTWPRLPPPEPPAGWVFEKVPTDKQLSIYALEADWGGFDVYKASAETAWQWLDALGYGGV